jgi:hypothetical protein
MAIVLKSGLVALKNGVQSYFDKQGVTAQVSLGWSQRTQQGNQGDGRANRVVFIPSDASGKCGKFTSAEQPGDRSITNDAGVVVGVVRALRTWHRLVEVSVWACDTEHMTDEDAQAEATDALLEWTMRAVHRAAAPVTGGNRGLGHANVEWGDVRTSLSPVDRSFGRELIASFVYRHPIFDEIQEIRFPANAQVNRVLNPTT